MEKVVTKVTFQDIINYIKKYKGFGFLTYPALEKTKKQDNTIVNNYYENHHGVSPSQVSSPNTIVTEKHIIQEVVRPSNENHPIPITYSNYKPTIFDNYEIAKYNETNRQNTEQIVRQLQTIYSELQSFKNSENQNIQTLIASVQHILAEFRKPPPSAPAASLNLNSLESLLDNRFKQFTEAISQMEDRKMEYEGSTDLETLEDDEKAMYMQNVLSLLTTISNKLDKAPSISIIEAEKMINSAIALSKDSQSEFYNTSINSTLANIQAFLKTLESNKSSMKKGDESVSVTVDNSALELSISNLSNQIAILSNDIKANKVYLETKPKPKIEPEVNMYTGSNPGPFPGAGGAAIKIDSDSIADIVKQVKEGIPIPSQAFTSNQPKIIDQTVVNSNNKPPPPPPAAEVSINPNSISNIVSQFKQIFESQKQQAAIDISSNSINKIVNSLKELIVKQPETVSVNETDISKIVNGILAKQPSTVSIDPSSISAIVAQLKDVLDKSNKPAQVVTVPTLTKEDFITILNSLKTELVSSRITTPNNSADIIKTLKEMFSNQPQAIATIDKESIKDIVKEILGNQQNTIKLDSQTIDSIATKIKGSFDDFDGSAGAAALVTSFSSQLDNLKKDLPELFSKITLTPSEPKEAAEMLNTLKKLEVGVNKLALATTNSNESLVSLATTLVLLRDNTELNFEKLNITSNNTVGVLEPLLRQVANTNVAITGTTELIDKVISENASNNGNIVSLLKQIDNKSQNILASQPDLSALTQSVNVNIDLVKKVLASVPNLTEQNKKILEEIVNSVKASDKEKKELLTKILNKKSTPDTSSTTMPIISNKLQSVVEQLEDIKRKVDSNDSLIMDTLVKKTNPTLAKISESLDIIKPKIVSLKNNDNGPPPPPAPQSSISISNDNRPPPPPPAPQSSILISDDNFMETNQPIEVKPAVTVKPPIPTPAEPIAAIKRSNDEDLQEFRPNNAIATDREIEKMYEKIQAREAKLKRARVEQITDTYLMSKFYGKEYSTFIKHQTDLNNVLDNIYVEMNELDKIDMNEFKNVVGGTSNMQGGGGTISSYLSKYNNKFNTKLNSAEIRTRLNEQAKMLSFYLKRHVALTDLVHVNEKANKSVVNEFIKRFNVSSKSLLTSTPLEKTINNGSRCSCCMEVYSAENREINLACGHGICVACSNVLGAPKCFIDWTHNKVNDKYQYDISKSLDYTKSYRPQTVGANDVILKNKPEMIATKNKPEVIEAIKNPEASIINNPRDLSTLQENVVPKQMEDIEKNKTQLLAVLDLVINLKIGSLSYDEKLRFTPFNAHLFTEIRSVSKLIGFNKNMKITSLLLKGLTLKERYDILFKARDLKAKLNLNILAANDFNDLFLNIFGPVGPLPAVLNPFALILRSTNSPITRSTNWNLDENYLANAAEAYLNKIKTDINNYSYDPIAQAPLVSRLLPITNDSGIALEGNDKPKEPQVSQGCNHCGVILKDIWWLMSHETSACSLCIACGIKSFNDTNKCIACNLKITNGRQEFSTRAMDIIDSKMDIVSEVPDEVAQIESMLSDQEKIWMQRQNFRISNPNLPIPAELDVPNPWEVRPKALTTDFNNTDDLQNLTNLANSIDVSNTKQVMPYYSKEDKPSNQRSVLLDENDPNTHLIQDNRTPTQPLNNSKPNVGVPDDFTKVSKWSMGFNPLTTNKENAIALIANKGHMLDINKNPEIQIYPKNALFEGELAKIDVSPNINEEHYNTTINNYFALVSKQLVDLKYFDSNAVVTPQPPIENQMEADNPNDQLVPNQLVVGHGIDKPNHSDHFNKLYKRYIDVPLNKRSDHIASVLKDDISNHRDIAFGILKRYHNNIHKMGNINDAIFDYKTSILRKKQDIKPIKRIPDKIADCDNCNQTLFNKKFLVHNDQDSSPIKGGVICETCFSKTNMLPGTRKPLLKNMYLPAHESDTSTAKGILKKIHKKIIQPFKLSAEQPSTLWETFVKSVPYKYNVDRVIHKCKTDILLTSETVSDLDFDYYIICLAYNTFTDKSNEILKANIFSISYAYAQMRQVDYLDFHRINFNKFKTFEHLKDYISNYPEIVLQFIPHDD